MTSNQPDVAILTAGHDVADARLHKIVGAFVRRGLVVEVHGLGQVIDGPADAAVRAVPRGGMLRRAMRAASLPWRSKAGVLMTLDPDVVPFARFAGALRRRQVVVDVHEDYAKLLADRPWARGVIGLGAAAIVRLATRLSATAQLTVVAGDNVPPYRARRRMVVPNLPDAELMPEPKQREATPRAVYIGDIRESRGLFDMVEAVAGADGWELDLVGPVAASDQNALDERLSRPDVAGRVRLHGRKPPEQAWRVAEGAWVGFVMLHDTPAFREAASTKAVEYLAAGLVLMATPRPPQIEVVEASQAGVIVKDASEAAAVLRQWATDPTQVDSYQSAARSWSARAAAKPSPYDLLADTVAGLVRPSPTP